MRVAFSILHLLVACAAWSSFHRQLVGGIERPQVRSRENETEKNDRNQIDSEVKYNYELEVHFVQPRRPPHQGVWGGREPPKNKAGGLARRAPPRLHKHDPAEKKPTTSHSVVPALGTRKWGPKPWDT
jgi:hypothetical protein